MRQTAAAVVVGGGVVGASIAYHLAERGLTDVVVVERGALGSGSTGKSAGGVRQQFSTEVNCRLSMLSVQKLLRLEVDTGWDPSFRQDGYLFLLTTEEHWQLFQRNVELQRSLGLEVQVVSAADVQEMVPPVVVDDVVGATFCATDGHADPTQVCLGYAAGARARGVEIVPATTVTGIDVQGGLVSAVVTSGGRIETPLVIDAAGPWAASIAQLAGVDLPIQPYRRQLYYTERPEGIGDHAPMVVDFASSMYFRPEGPGLLLGMTDRSEPSSFNTNTDDVFLALLIEHAVARVPALEQADLLSGWAGLYDVTPDANPILGRIPEIEGFVVAAGFSGHGFMHAPATGQLIAELIVDGTAHTIDISSLSVVRFRDGQVQAEQNVI